MRMGRFAGLVLLFTTPVFAETPPGEALARLKSVGREGAGNAAASRAWKEVVALGPSALPEILAAMDGADATSANWLRTAVDAIAERAVASGGKLPAAQLEQFVRDTRHNGAARRLAYEWLCRVDPKAPERLLPGMIQDPSPELRRDAVAAVIQEADALFDKGDREAALAAYRKALAGACDKDQVERLSKQLGKLGDKVDLASHFGFVTRWLLAAPFDNTKEAGFAIAYRPEKSVDPRAVYKGKKGDEVRWTPYTTTNPYGIVNLNNAMGKQQGVVCYAYAIVESPAERPIQVRAGSQNAIKVFLNGQEIYHREEYHHGMEVDQHIASARLKAGRNELLMKVCQNEQKEDWAQQWSFQVRLCDTVGAAVPFKLVSTMSDAPKREEGKR